MLLILTGPPGSGKSYFAEHFGEKHSFTHINSDQVRMMYFSNPTFNPSERVRVYDKIFECAEEALQHEKNVLLDGNIITNKERWETLTRFETLASVLFVAFDVPTHVALNRAINRHSTEDKLYKPMNPERARAMHDEFETLDPKLPHIVLKGYGKFSEGEAELLRALDTR